MTVWTACHCTRVHSTPRGFIRCKLPRAGSITGSGDWALIAWCPRDSYTVTLSETDTDAYRLRSTLNLYGCGPDCRRAHQIVRIDHNRKQATP